jgi:hypothetical protein
MPAVVVAGISYKELYDCKWDAMTLTKYTLYTSTLAFKFL